MQKVLDSNENILIFYDCFLFPEISVNAETHHTKQEKINDGSSETLDRLSRLSERR